MNFTGLNGISANTAALLGATIEKLIEEKILTSQNLEDISAEDIAVEIRRGMRMFIDQVGTQNIIVYITDKRNK